MERLDQSQLQIRKGLQVYRPKSTFRRRNLQLRTSGFGSGNLTERKLHVGHNFCLFRGELPSTLDRSKHACDERLAVLVGGVLISEGRLSKISGALFHRFDESVGSFEVDGRIGDGHTCSFLGLKLPIDVL